MKVVLEGVACLGKTTVSTMIATRTDYKVALVDYAEFHNTTKNLKLAEKIFDSLYIAWYNKNSMTGHLIDRSPVSNVLYGLIYAGSSDEECEDAFRGIKALGILDDLNILVFLPKEGTEQTIVDKMIHRNNGIDLWSLEYVKAQKRVFTHFATYFRLQVLEIDITNNMTEEMERVYNEVTHQLRLND